MATIYDIAKHVGVSAGTVSRALSRPDKVLPATRTRIEQAAAALGYVPNTVARTLKTQRSGKILVTVPDIANPFFAQILQGAEDAAQAVGYAVLLGDTQDQPDREERYAQMLRRNEADGMIVLGHRLPPTAREIVQQRGLPRRWSTAASSIPRWACPVCTSTMPPPHAVMEHLYALGHERIAVVGGPPDNPCTSSARKGYGGPARCVAACAS